MKWLKIRGGGSQDTSTVCRFDQFGTSSCLTLSCAYLTDTFPKSLQVVTFHVVRKSHRYQLNSTSIGLVGSMYVTLKIMWAGFRGKKIIIMATPGFILPDAGYGLSRSDLPKLMIYTSGKRLEGA